MSNLAFIVAGEEEARQWNPIGDRDDRVVATPFSPPRDFRGGSFRPHHRRRDADLPWKSMFVMRPKPSALNAASVVSWTRAKGWAKGPTVMAYAGTEEGEEDGEDIVVVVVVVVEGEGKEESGVTRQMAHAVSTEALPEFRLWVRASRTPRSAAAASWQRGGGQTGGEARGRTRR